MIWTEEQLAEFRIDPNVGEKSIYADSIMRPMAAVFCPSVLKQFDEEWNTGNDPLGPNWHGFAGDLERAILNAHAWNDEAKLHSYYSFLNWALFEKTSYLSNETVVSPFEGIATQVKAKKWMKYVPLHILSEDMIPFMAIYFEHAVATSMRFERNVLKADPGFHERFWKPCHEAFTKVAEEKSIPYTNFLG